MSGFSQVHSALRCESWLRKTLIILLESLSDASRSGNCKAGFVADRGLSSAFAKDFYLLSHGGLLGSRFFHEDLDVQ
jgi:hypothetical protein